MILIHFFFFFKLTLFKHKNPFCVMNFLLIVYCYSVLNSFLFKDYLAKNKLIFDNYQQFFFFFLL